MFQLNIELSVLYCDIGQVWNRINIDIDEPFIFMIVKNLPYEKDDSEPRTIEDAMNRSDWLQ